MFCSKCGNILPDNAKFCTSCGAPVEKATKINEDCSHSHNSGTYAEPSRPYTPPQQPKYEIYEEKAVSRRQTGLMPPMKPGEALRRFVANVINFSGRARRSEYWWVVLITGVIGLILEEISGDLASFWNVILLIPTISLTVRRLHDAGKGTLYILWSILPLVGPLLILVHLVKDSEPGDNRYGPNPKEI